MAQTVILKQTWITDMTTPELVTLILTIGAGRQVVLPRLTRIVTRQDRFNLAIRNRTERTSMKGYDQFHDGYFEGIWIPAKGTAHVYLATSDRQRSTAVLTGVVMVKVTGFKEGNIIFDVGIRCAHDPTPDEIANLYDLKPGHEPAAWELQLLDKVRNESLCLFEINCSYGGECLILAESVELLSQGQWIERHMPVRSPR